MEALVLNVRDLVGPAPDPVSEAGARKRISDRHHLAARLFASGSSPAEVGAITGFAGTTLSILQNDPSFRELVSFYRTKVAEKFDVFGQRLALVGEAAQAEILERLENEPASFSPKELTQLMTVAADRTGHGPKSNQSVNVTVTMSERLRSARAKVIDGEIIDG